ncbi:MAG: hypothetical protein QUV05_00280 [Phycisphaerae bacterium]|nr:hypothetical protein [Phycisphaerae bacterium]
MPLPNPFRYFAFGDLFNTVLPDFVLAFAFFTAIVYAVLGRRFGQQRPAVAMSAALGMALSIGLVSWEYTNNLSIRNLGPIAAGFAVLILGGVIYQSIKGAGGSWAGAGIALGASLLVGWTLGFDWPEAREIVQSVITVALVVGILAFLLHRRGIAGHVPRALSSWSESADLRHDASDLYRDERASRGLSRGLRRLRHEARQLQRHPKEHPEAAGDILVQLRRILPAEGWLTERMARLREKAHLVRQGHLTRIKELEQHMAGLPPEVSRKAAQELTTRYKELQLDTRLERLDRAVAETERRIRQLTRQAEADLEAGNHRALANVLDVASRLQRHNAHLFKLIDSTELRLMSAARQAAGQAKG